MKLQFLVPQYKEDDKIIKPLLDSIAIQQNVDFNEIGMIIVNDGSDVKLSKELLESYPFRIDYHDHKHAGVSAIRNACLDYATADYVMWCDIDDMFCDVDGLFLIFKEMKGEGFDAFTSVFREEGRHPQTKEPLYINRGAITPNGGGIDSTFVHGKVYRRQYLLNNNIRWNDKLTIHEDSYFNILAQNLTTKLKYCPMPFYLWKWRDDSVCRHDDKYILKTFNNLIDSNTALIKQFLSRNMKDKASQFVTMMVFDAWLTLNKDEWINQENQEYRNNTETRFKEYYKEFRDMFLSVHNSTDPKVKQLESAIIIGQKNRFFREGMLLEKITFDDWLKHIETEIR